MTQHLTLSTDNQEAFEQYAAGMINTTELVLVLHGNGVHIQQFSAKPLSDGDVPVVALQAEGTSPSFWYILNADFGDKVDGWPVLRRLIVSL